MGWIVPGRMLYIISLCAQGEDRDMIIGGIGSDGMMGIVGNVSIGIGAEGVEICGNEYVYIDSVNNTVISIDADLNYTKTVYPTANFSLTNIQSISCSSGTTLEVLASTASGQNYLAVFRLNKYTQDNKLHSLTLLPTLLNSSMVSIPNVFYTGAQNPDIYLTFIMTNNSLDQSNMLFYDVWATGPHALVDYSPCKSGSGGQADFNFTISSNENGVVTVRNYSSSLFMSVPKYYANVYPLTGSLPQLQVGTYALSSVAKVSGLVQYIQTVNGTMSGADIFATQAYPTNRSYLNDTGYYPESVLSRDLLFASGPQGLLLVNVSAKNPQNMIFPPTNCSAKGLSAVKVSNADDANVFYCVCSTIGGSITVQSLVVIYVSSTPGQISQTQIKFERRGFSKFVMIQRPDIINADVYIFAGVNSIQPASVTVGQISYYDQTTDLGVIRTYNLTTPYPSNIFAIGYYSQFLAVFTAGWYDSTLSTLIVNISNSSKPANQIQASYQIKLPGLENYHVPSKLSCDSNSLVKGRVYCIMNGAVTTSYAYTIDMIPDPVLGLNVSVFSSSNIVNLPAVNYTGVKLVDNFTIFTIRNLGSLSRFGAYRDDFWLSICSSNTNCSIPAGLITSSVSAFNPTVTLMQDGRSTVFPGSPLQGTLTVLEAKPATIVVNSLGTLNSQNQNITFKFQGIQGYVDSTINLSQFFTIPPEPLPPRPPYPEPTKSGWRTVLIILGLLLLAGLAAVAVLFYRTRNAEDKETYASVKEGISVHE